MGESLPLLKGTLDLLVLKALSVEPTHGYGVARWLEARSGGTIGAEDSALYQSLHRLEERGLVRASWGRTENNRKARFYELSAKGRRRLEAEAETWRRYARSVETVLAVDGG